jgi:hypothetical protein
MRISISFLSFVVLLSAFWQCEAKLSLASSSMSTASPTHRNPHGKESLVCSNTVDRFRSSECSSLHSNSNFFVVASSNAAGSASKSAGMVKMVGLFTLWYAFNAACKSFVY